MNPQPPIWARPLAAGQQVSRPSILPVIIGLLAAPLLALFTIVLMVGLFRTPVGATKVYLLNGLDEAYEVEANGERLTLEPRQAVRMKHGGTTIFVNPVGEHAQVRRFTRILDDTLFDLVSNEPVYVVNPDGLAYLQLVEKRTGAFASKYPSTQDFAGDTWYRFEGVAYPFKPFPANLDKGPAGVHRRIETSQPEPYRFLLAASSCLDDDQFAGFAKRLVAMKPEDDQMYRAVYAFLTPDVFTEIVRPRLEDRPLRVELHELYQLANAGSSWLMSEYEELDASLPDSGDAVYLHANLVEDYEQSNKLLLESVRRPQWSSAGAMEIARRLLQRGEFEAAWTYASKGYDPSAGDAFDAATYEDSALAAGHREIVLQHLLETLEKRKDPDEALSEWYLGPVVEMYAELGRIDEAQDLIRKSAERIRKVGNQADSGNYWRDYLQSQIALGQGNFAEYSRQYEKMNESEYDYVSQMWKGDLAKAFEFMQDESEYASEFLLLYALAVQKGDEVVAKDSLRTAIEWFEYEEGEELVAMLRGETPPSWEAILRLDYDPAEKRSVLVALGTRFPSIRYQTYQLAEKMNYQRGDTYFLVQQVLKGTKGVAGEAGNGE